LASHGRKVEKFGRPALKVEGILAATGLSFLTFICFCKEVAQEN